MELDMKGPVSKTIPWIVQITGYSSNVPVTFLFLNKLSVVSAVAESEKVVLLSTGSRSHEDYKSNKHFEGKCNIL